MGNDRPQNLMMNNSQRKSLEMVGNIFVEEKLQATISFTSLFVLILEILKDNVIDCLLEFYSSDMDFKDNQIVYHENAEYKQKVKSLAKKPFHASLHWFVKQGVITDSEYDRLLEAEARRNDFVHELYNVVCAGVQEPDIQLLADLMSIYKKIDSWWIYNIETDWDEIENPDSVKMEDCISCSLAMIDVMVRILLKGEGDTYRRCYMQIKDAVTKKAGNNTSSNKATS